MSDNSSSSEFSLVFKTAREQARFLADGEISSEELVTAHLNQIERVNPSVNAIVTLVAESALDQAKAADQSRIAGVEAGPFQGMPVLIKDLQDTKGILTTQGSPIYRDHIPERDALIVDRLKKAGAIVIGKSNTPEFGAGSQTFNSVFGTNGTTVHIGLFYLPAAGGEPPPTCPVILIGCSSQANSHPNTNAAKKRTPRNKRKLIP